MDKSFEIEELKSFLLSKEYVIKKDDNTIVFNINDKLGTIAFYNPYIEMFIEKDNRICFYLQSEMIDNNQIKEYLNNFFAYLNDDLLADNDISHIIKHKNILFACSCGVTSAYLMENCQRIAKELNIDVTYFSCAVDNIDLYEKDVDVIYFLPQIKYLLVKDGFKQMCKIKVLPTKYVALRDIDSIFRFSLSA